MTISSSWSGRKPAGPTKNMAGAVPKIYKYRWPTSKVSDYVMEQFSLIVWTKSWMMLVQAFSLRNSFLLDPCDSSYRKELEAGKPAWMQKCHWTVGPKCSCGLDSALTYKGIMDMRLDVAVAGCGCPCRNIHNSSERRCHCGLVSSAAQVCSACAPFCFSLLVRFLRGQVCVACKEWGSLALWKRVIADTEVCIWAYFSLC